MRLVAVLGAAQVAAGHATKARSTLQEALELAEESIGLKHPAALEAKGALAAAMAANGDLATAEILQREVLAGRQAALGPGYPDTYDAMATLAVTQLATGDQGTALAVQRKVLAGRRVVLGLDHPDTLDSMLALAETLRALGHADRATGWRNRPPRRGEPPSAQVPRRRPGPGRGDPGLAGPATQLLADHRDHHDGGQEVEQDQAELPGRGHVEPEGGQGGQDEGHRQDGPEADAGWSPPGQQPQDDGPDQAGEGGDEDDGAQRQLVQLGAAGLGRDLEADVQDLLEQHPGEGVDDDGGDGGEQAGRQTGPAGRAVREGEPVPVDASVMRTSCGATGRR